MAQQTSSIHFYLEPEDNNRLLRLCGDYEKHLQFLEKNLSVEINHHGHKFQIIGPKDRCLIAQEAIFSLYEETEHTEISEEHIHLTLYSMQQMQKDGEKSFKTKPFHLRHSKIYPRNPNQSEYLENMEKYDVNFGIGPSGTGKTYLAVAAAVHALECNQVKRILLVRPAVEAGEKLGFLPGDLSEKVNPYLRPLYDALHDMIGGATLKSLIDEQVIEIAPLAYMRGRTLNEAYIILDESQNTTREQMKMCLTRLGFGSKMVITGDITQIDLPNPQASGLRHALSILQSVNDIAFTFFTADDVVRHGLVQKIVRAYEANNTQDSTS